MGGLRGFGVMRASALLTRTAWRSPQRPCCSSPHNAAADHATAARNAPGGCAV
ncbi:hypothetical protein XCR_1615 [Xanthomonas campestris pv. raphani 756C]|nr:hypothetical protein XCR_1615 [Xanthomonas campestris pv. raphani 756C]